MRTQPWTCKISVAVVTYLTFTTQLSFTTRGVNMAAPLITWTKEDQLTMIRHLQAENVNVRGIR